MKKTILNTIKKCLILGLVEVILIVLNVKLAVYPASIIGKIVDLLYNVDTTGDIILQKICIMMLICGLILIVRTVWKYIEVYIDNIFTTALRNELFGKLLRIHLESLKDIKNGEIMSYFASDVKQIRSFASRAVSTITRIIITMIIVISSIGEQIDFNLTIAIVIPIFITIVGVMILKKYVEKNYKEAQKNFTSMSEYVKESTDSIRTSKAYVGEEKQIEEFIKKNKKVRDSNNKLEIYANLLHISIQLCIGICYSISLIYGSYLNLIGKISIGELVTVNGYLAMLIMPLESIPWIVNKYKRAQVSYKRLDKVFKLKEEKIQITGSRTVDNQIKGSIKIKDLSYKYPGTDKFVLKNINISIDAGKSLGIIGELGSGKTTLTNLLLKLYSVPRDKIYIDEIDINDIDTMNLREETCYTTQENFLFSASLKDNINLFRDEYEDKEIELSTVEAMIHDDIIEMPETINTIIGEKGIDLSGGQKQRVVISRAFLKQSKILIFDDTFSALDNRTQSTLLKNIRKLTKNRTCIIISNRISDIKHCDEIIVMEKGCIKERGKHQELIELNGMYYNYYKDQISKPTNSILD